ncbi:MAG: hypothetical protein WC299_02800 [Kiritimatiellia bacterium]
MNNIYHDYCPAPGAASSGSSGMVLVTVVIFAAVATALAAGLYSAGGTRVKQGQREIRFDKAFFVAEAGVERAKAYLRNRGTNNSVLFGGTTNFGDGTFHVSVRPNAVGTNEYVIIRSTGTVELATRVLEVEVRVIPPTPFVPGISDGSVCFYGTNSSLYLKNANNHVSGYDWAVPVNFTGNGAACDGTLTTNDGTAGVYYYDPATAITGTGDIEGNPATTNWAGLYDETYWYDFVDELLPYSHVYSSVAPDWGTREAPSVTILPSGLTTISANADGAGVLIVPGGANLRIVGTFHFEGILVIIGDGVVDNAPEAEFKGTFDMFGSTVCLGGALNIESTGRACLKYSTEALANLSRLAINETLAQLDVVYWREVKN